MKALTISQPFASLIASGEKWVENRSWFCRHRGPLAIHAGKGTQYLTRTQLRRFPTGAVVAVADVVACLLLETAREGTARAVQPREVQLLEAAGLTLEELLAHEHAEGPYCIVLANVRRLAEPVPCRGKQGLWDWPAAALRLPEPARAR